MKAQPVTKVSSGLMDLPVVRIKQQLASLICKLCNLQSFAIYFSQSLQTRCHGCLFVCLFVYLPCLPALCSLFVWRKHLLFVFFRDRCVGTNLGTWYAVQQPQTREATPASLPPNVLQALYLCPSVSFFVLFLVIYHPLVEKRKIIAQTQKLVPK